MRRSRRDVLHQWCALGSIGAVDLIASDTLDRTLFDPQFQLQSGAGSERKGSSTGEWPENGVVSFVYHDGPINDYTEVYPAHTAFETVATICPVAEWIGRHYGVAERLTENHLHELAEEGWEIASHTADHSVLGEFSINRDIDSGDHRIYPARHRHGHHTGHEVEITDGDRTVQAVVAGYGDDKQDNRYVELETPVGQAFNRRETVIRWPEERMRHTLSESKKKLERMGFEISSLLAPYDVFDDYAMRFVPDYYDFVANGTRGSKRINDPDSYDPYETIHRYFIEFTGRHSVKRDLDEIARTGAFGVLGAHSFKDEVTEKRIRETLQWISDRDIAVMTFNDAATLASG